MKQVKQFIKEIIPVIFGVLIALIINNWNEDRKDKKYLNQIFSSIQEELQESRIDIKETLPRQQILLDSIEFYLNNESVSIFEIALKAKGVQAPTIKNNAWKSIAASKIELIEYKKISDLSDIDEKKEILKLQIEKTIDFLYGNLKETDKHKKEVFKIMILDLINTEKSLLTKIEKLTEK